MTGEDTVVEQGEEHVSGGAASDALAAALSEDLENEGVEDEDANSTKTPEGEPDEKGDTSGDRKDDSRLTAEEAHAIQMVNNYNTNPQGYLAVLAQQQGLTLVPVGSNGKPAEEKEESAEVSDVEFPEDLVWLKEPIMKVVESLVSRQMSGMATKQDLQGMEATVAPIQQQNVERELDGLWEDWRKHEDAIASTLQMHPTLASDLPRLVKLVSPTVDTKAATLAEKGSKAKRTSARKGASATVATKPKVEGIPFRESVSNAFDAATQTLRERGEL